MERSGTDVRHRVACRYFGRDPALLPPRLDADRRPRLGAERRQRCGPQAESNPALAAGGGVDSGGRFRIHVQQTGGIHLEQSLPDRRHADRSRNSDVDRRAPGWREQVLGPRRLGRRPLDRPRAGARHRTRRVAQRHHHHHRIVPQPHPRDCGALLVPACHARHRRGSREKPLGHPQARRHRARHASACPTGHCAQRNPGRSRNCPLPPLPPPQQPDALRVLSRRFWHNSNRSGCIFPLPRGMRILGPTRFRRVNEALALVFLAAGLFFTLSFVSYHPQDPSWNWVSGALRAHNLTGFAGAYTADLWLQLLGLGAFGIPVLLWILAWAWARSEEIPAPLVKVLGSILLLLSACTALSIGPEWRPWSGAVSAGGNPGVTLAYSLMASLNLTGAVLLTAISLIISVYLISSFSMAKAAEWIAGPLSFLRNAHARWANWRGMRRRLALERAQLHAEKKAQAIAGKEAAREAKQAANQSNPAPPPPPGTPRIH